ncbi:MAG TPA: hypothetical protein VFK80_00225 [Limnochordia bacterium]|nr:hypothetical protein [Limnochordia bacterium]
MPVPVPSQVTNPQPGTTETLEVATPGASPTFQTVALADQIEFAPSDNIENFQPFNADGANMNVKTGRHFTLNVTSAAADDDAAMALLIAAGEAIGDSAVLFFRIKHADGSYHSGSMTVGSPNYGNANRNVRKVVFACTTTGTVTYTSAASAA